MGCGKKVDDGECVYHTGEPVFHERTRKWACCGASSNSFDEFLSLPGCTSGPHRGPSAEVAERNSNAAQSAKVSGPRYYVHFEGEEGKPELSAVFPFEETKTLAKVKEDFVVRYNRQHNSVFTLRMAACVLVSPTSDGDPGSTPLDPKKVVADVLSPGDDLFVILYDHPAQPATPPPSESSAPPTSEEVAQQAPDEVVEEERDPHAPRMCLNFGCTQPEFTDATNTPTACAFHFAPPFFHDASQGYECCSRVMSFDEFQAIPPCQTGPHNDTPHAARPPVSFSRKRAEDDVVFSQTESTVTLTFTLPGTTRSGVDVDVEDEEIMIIISRDGQKDFSFVVDPLARSVVPGKSSVSIQDDQVAITLTKASKGKTWPGISG